MNVARTRFQKKKDKWNALKAWWTEYCESIAEHRQIPNPHIDKTSIHTNEPNKSKLTLASYNIAIATHKRQYTV